MRILHVIPSFHPAVRYGGPVETALRLTQCLADLGHDVRVVTTDADGLWDTVDCERARALDPAEGPEIRRCKRNLPPDLSSDLVGETIDGTAWADVVHVTAVYSFSTLTALGAARAAGKPCVWSPRGSFQANGRRATQPLKAAWRVATRLLLPRSCVLHATSKEEAERTERRYPGIPVAIVPNGVDLPPAVARKPQGKVLNVLFLGRLDPIKRIDLLLAGVVKARSHGLDVRLSVAGEGPTDTVRALRAVASELGLAEVVRWQGHVRGGEKERCFADADLLALVSESESFGMVVAEALARSIPVVAGDGTPWSELVPRGCGFWIESTADAIASALEAATRADLSDMGARGRAWMMAEFRWERRAEEMEAVYVALLDGTFRAASREARGGREAR